MKFDWSNGEPEEELPCELEYLAEPRLRTCAVCDGCGTANAKTCVGCSGEGILFPPYAKFEKETVYRGMIAKWTRSPWIVTVDDVPYCGFGDRETATKAVKLWLGYVDGLGRIVEDRKGCHWPGAEGRVIRVYATRMRSHDQTAGQ